MGENGMKPTHGELAARAMLLGDRWFYDWRDGTFTNVDAEGTIEMYDPETMKLADRVEMASRRLGKIIGWQDSLNTQHNAHLWETPVARMDDNDSIDER